MDDTRGGGELGIEVAGAAADVWAAVATGTGISAWRAPTRLTPQVGGTLVTQTALGTVAERVTACDPPHRLAVASGPRTTTWLVEPPDPGSSAPCRVRVLVDGVLPAEGAALGEELAAALVRLAAGFSHHDGRPGAEVVARGPAPAGGPDDHERAHARFLARIGVVAPRQRLTTFVGVPELTGTCLERRAGHHHSAALVLLDGPAPGLASFTTVGAPAVHEVHLTLHGAAPDDPAITDDAGRQQRAWERWLRTG